MKLLYSKLHIAASGSLANTETTNAIPSNQLEAGIGEKDYAEHLSRTTAQAVGNLAQGKKFQCLDVFSTLLSTGRCRLFS